MTSDEFRGLLQSTLDDLQVSRSERRALAAALRDDPPNDSQWAEFRSIAFGIARDAITDTVRSRDVLNWLEDAIKLLIPKTPASTAGCRGDVCFSPGEACRDRIAGLFRAAARTVDVCVFTITDDLISESIIQAHQRGIRVRIITDDMKADDLGSDIHRFRSAGIDVRTDRSRHHMHHKFAIFDGGRLVTGSYNWTRGAAFDNEEHIVILSDPALLQSFQQEFDRLWESYR